jgi:hypothetical protein
MQLQTSIGSRGTASDVTTMVVIALVCGLLAFVVWS